MKLHVIVGLFVVAGVFAAGWFMRDAFQRPKLGSDLTAVDVRGARPPLWANLDPCRDPNAIEQRQHQVALEVLEVFDGDWLNPLQRGAIRHFAYPWEQRRGATRDEKSLPCPPLALYPRVATAALKAGVFGRPFLYADGIALAQQLGPRDPQIVRAVAHSAFLDHSIPDDAFRADLRPYARLVLAEFGSAAREWAGLAMAEVSAANQLGTGAAQVAVAGGAPEALPKVQRLMEQLISATPRDKLIPRLARNRIYEMAFALGMAGEGAQPYAAPLVELLDRRVESWAPPFGMIGSPPARMCPVAERIGGSVAEAARTKDFCVRRPKALEE
jgi:hypothetical protein